MTKSLRTAVMVKLIVLWCYPLGGELHASFPAVKPRESNIPLLLLKHLLVHSVSALVPLPTFSDLVSISHIWPSTAPAAWVGEYARPWLILGLCSATCLFKNKKKTVPVKDDLSSCFTTASRGKFSVSIEGIDACNLDPGTPITIMLGGWDLYYAQKTP